MPEASVPTTRPAAVAGRFYPAEAERLAAVVDQYLDAGRLELRRLDEAPGGGLAESPSAIVAPHAGYPYSGPTAGIATATLVGEEVERLVVIGPSHFVALRGLGIPSADRFETPLGPVTVDTECLAELLRLPQVAVNDAAHQREHGIEVLLPFLQRALGSFRLVPLVVGQATPEQVVEVLELARASRIVVSSDLSHFHDYHTAQQLDRGTARAIERLDPSAIGPDRACGAFALNGLLELANRRGLAARTLDLRNSGDTAGLRNRVVGYGAWAFTRSDAAAPRDDGP